MFEFKSSVSNNETNKKIGSSRKFMSLQIATIKQMNGENWNVFINNKFVHFQVWKEEIWTMKILEKKTEI